MLTETDYFGFTIVIIKEEIGYSIVGNGLKNFMRVMDLDGKNYMLFKANLKITIKKGNDDNWIFDNLYITNIEETDKHKIIELKTKEGTLRIKYNINFNECKFKTMDVSYHSYIEF